MKENVHSKCGEAKPSHQKAIPLSKCKGFCPATPVALEVIKDFVNNEERAPDSCHHQSRLMMRTNWPKKILAQLEFFLSKIFPTYYPPIGSLRYRLLVAHQSSLFSNIRLRRCYSKVPAFRSYRFEVSSVRHPIEEAL